MGLGSAISTLGSVDEALWGANISGFVMAELLSPVAAGAGLAVGLLFLMAVSNGISSLVFNKSITEFVSGRLGSGE